MRYLILSDLHANLEATDAVLEAAAALSIDRALVLGDLVGYGPNPNEVVDRVLGLKDAMVIRGNHDRVASGLSPDDDFNPRAQAAVRWTAAALTPAVRDYLIGLVAGPLAVDDRIEICHGAPFDEDFYVFSPSDASLALKASTRPVCLFGHTHVAMAYGGLDGRVDTVGPYGAAPFTLALAGNTRWLLNCGAVGQPRDGDWRAAFGVLDTDAQTCAFHRAEYDVRTTQRRIRDAGLPASLAQRLGPGR
ncbi:MAG: metallophosphoesterase family protein [Vicinamibacterales bacterium]